MDARSCPCNKEMEDNVNVGGGISGYPQSMTNERLWKKTETALRRLIPSYLFHFEVNVADHCNLNCASCDHYSPLAEEGYLDISSYKRDCDRLSELFHGEMYYIFLLGGEPLLHPQITEIMRITREAFPVGEILIVTNGILLPSMPEEFWEACKKHDVSIAPTYYPIKVDYDGLKRVAESKGVEYRFFTHDHIVQKKRMICNTRIPSLMRNGSNYINCDCATECPVLKNGKIYPCPTAAYAQHLKKYFNLDIHLSEKNGVDIYSVESGHELLQKLHRPVPFCQYCDVTDERIAFDWRISKKSRYEWISFNFTEDDIQYLKSNKPVVYVFGAGLWGTQTVTLLKREGITAKYVLTTRKKQGIDDILGVPVIALEELKEIEPHSICLVAMNSPVHKSEVYPLLSQRGFENVVPVGELR